MALDKKSGIHVVSNPFYKGPGLMSAPIYKGKDLVLDVDEHNRVISKLLTRQKGEPESPTPEVCEEFPWAKVMGADAASRRGLNEQALRVLKTCLIFAAYFLLGGMVFLYSSAVMDYPEVTGDNGFTKQSLFWIAPAAAQLAVIATCFLLFLSKNKNMYVLAVATFIMGTASLVLPFGDSRTFIFYLAALAISIGSVDAGANISVLQLWRGRHEGWFQALHTFFLLGLAVSHSVLEPFFRHRFHSASPIQSETTTVIPDVKLEDLPNKEYLFVLEVDRSPKRVDIVGTLLGPTQDTAIARQERLDNLGAPTAYTAAVDDEFIMTPLPCFLVGIGFLCVAFYSFLRSRSQKVAFTDEEYESLKQIDDATSKSARVSKSIVGLLSVSLIPFTLLVSWLQILFGEYLHGYAFHQFGFSEHQARMISLVYWGCLVGGALVGTIAIRFVRSQTYLFLNFAFLFTSVVLWYFISHSLLWLMAVFTALGLSTFFACTVSYLYDTTGLSLSVHTCLIATRLFAILSSPLILELLILPSGSDFILKLSTIAVLPCGLFLILMHMAARRLILSAQKAPELEPQQKETGTRWLHEAGY